MYFNNKFFKLSIYKKKHLNWKYLEKINDIENVIDIGAAEGTPPLVYNFPKANYYYFEPLESFNEKLILFNKKNKINYQIFNVALSNYVGESVFNEVKLAPKCSSIHNLNNFWEGEKKDSTIKTKVSVDKLSNFKNKVFFENSIVKLDTQGNEIDVLEGADDEIFEKVKFFLIEISFHKRYEKQSTFDEIFMLLREKKFKLAGVVELNNEVKASQGDFLFCKSNDERSYF